VTTGAERAVKTTTGVGVIVETEERETRHQPSKQRRSGCKPRHPIPKPRKWREALTDRVSHQTYEDLAKIERETPRRNPPTTRKLLIKDIAVAPLVFQWRGEHSDLMAEERHMSALSRVFLWEQNDLRATS
jgi:hypothetical protein